MSDDEHLPVAEARAGAPEAWAALLARYRLPVYAFVFELIHDEQASLDLVQESFINAARHIGSLKQDAKFGSWLFNIAHQKVVQHWRKRRVDEIAIDPQDEDLPDPEPGPADLLIRQEQEAEFLRLLDELPAPHRAVLLLHFVEEFSLDEIARITDAQLGTVKSRLHYARKALKRLLEKQHENPEANHPSPTPVCRCRPAADRR